MSKIRKKSMSQSRKAGLTFSVGRTSSRMREQLQGQRISKTAVVYATASVECIVAQALKAVVDAALNSKEKRITLRHIDKARDSPDMRSILKSGVVLASMYCHDK